MSPEEVRVWKSVRSSDTLNGRFRPKNIGVVACAEEVFILAATKYSIRLLRNIPLREVWCCALHNVGIYTSRLMRTVAIVTAIGSALVETAGATGFDCLIESNQLVELASPVSGLLEKVAVKRGDVVRKGQALAQLESRAEQASTELARYKSEQLGPTRMAESKLDFSRRKFIRRKDMAAEKLMSPQERDDAEAEFKLAEAELQVAKDNKHLARLEYQQQGALLALRTIRSPFDGVVVDQLAYPGEIVELGSSKKAILKVAQLDPLRVHVILPKEVFGKLSVGMSVEVIPEVLGRGRYAAKVRSIDRLIDAASGTFVVFLELPNPKLEIPAGIKCRTVFPGVEIQAPASKNKAPISVN